MKVQIKVLAIAALVAVGAVSCKKDNDEPKPAPTPQPTKTQLMAQSKGWKMISMKTNGTEMFPILDACDKDDVMTFNTNSSYVRNMGAIKCEQGEPQTENGSWRFISSETKIILDEEDTAAVMTLTADTLRMQALSVENAQQNTIIATFVKAK